MFDSRIELSQRDSSLVITSFLFVVKLAGTNKKLTHVQITLGEGNDVNNKQ